MRRGTDRCLEQEGEGRGTDIDLKLVGHHVPQPLVVDHTHEDPCLQLRSRLPTVQRLCAKVIVAS